VPKAPCRLQAAGQNYALPALVSGWGGQNGRRGVGDSKLDPGFRSPTDPEFEILIK
jgi:hypothetical protein